MSLYADQEVAEPRPTDDVDVLIEILNYSERSQLEEILRRKGFSHDVESGIVCRYNIQGITIDIMPTEDSSIGFHSTWYAEGFQKATSYMIDETHTIRILSTPYFIASKLEAFLNRGHNDGRTSQDFEDIVFVLEHRKLVWDELSATAGKVSLFLTNEFKKLHNHPQIFEWIDAHVERVSPRATRRILSEIENFVS